ncbi:hypothetical protein BH11MYX2_BH11MYX2_38050 [soil metagenome]
MGPKRNPPRPTQKLGGESLERMARVSAGMEPLAKPPAGSSHVLPPPPFPLPEDRLVDVDPLPSMGRTRTLARTVKRADLELGKGGNVDEDDWGEIQIENDDMAVGSGGVESGESALEVDEPQALAGPAGSRAITNNDPITMALMAEVARSSKTEDFDPTDLDEAQRDGHGAPVGPDDRPSPSRTHPHLKRRDK